MELKICHLYPDILNLYGDRGNILCMGAAPEMAGHRRGHHRRLGRRSPESCRL